jgi:hypothetical protein
MLWCHGGAACAEIDGAWGYVGAAGKKWPRGARASAAAAALFPFSFIFKERVRPPVVHSRFRHFA